MATQDCLKCGTVNGDGQPHGCVPVEVEHLFATDAMSDLEIASRNLDYVLASIELKDATFNLVRVAYEVEILLRRNGEDANAAWFRRHIQAAEIAAENLRGGMK